jgi:hypothetical protein
MEQAIHELETSCNNKKANMEKTILEKQNSLEDEKA